MTFYKKKKWKQKPENLCPETQLASTIIILMYLNKSTDSIILPW